MMRIGLRELLELDQAQLLERDLLALGLADAFHLEPEGDVAKRGAPGKELRKVLEHNAAVGALATDGLTADADFSAGGHPSAAQCLGDRGLAPPINRNVLHDNYPLPPRSRVLVMIRFDGAKLGRFVFHCHILEHEDKGMMATIAVVEEPPP